MHGLRSLIFTVDELAKAKAFYAAFLSKPPYFDEPFYVGFDVDGFELGLRPADDVHRPGVGGACTYVHVADVDAALARLLELGARPHEPAADYGEGLRLGAVVDPFGNVLGVISNLHFTPRLTHVTTEANLSPRRLQKVVTVAAPRAEVWRRFTTSAGVATWLSPKTKIELTVGGPWEVYFLDEQPLGSRGSELCRVLSFLPERMLSFTWNAPPHLATTRHAHTWIVVELVDSPQGTVVTLTQLGWPVDGLEREPAWEATFQYFDRAWGKALEALVAAVG